MGFIVRRRKKDWQRKTGKIDVGIGKRKHCTTWRRKRMYGVRRSMNSKDFTEEDAGHRIVAEKDFFEMMDTYCITKKFSIKTHY